LLAVETFIYSGKLFESKEQAEEHGVDLCKEWIDEQFRVRGDTK